MRLRTQLVLAFLLLAIVPLTALTIYSYSSSIRAFRQAVKEEAGIRAAEMRTRMEEVNQDLHQRIERVGTLPLHRLVERDVENARTDAELIFGDLRQEMGEAAAILRTLKFRPDPTPQVAAIPLEPREVPPVPTELPQPQTHTVPESVVIYLPEMPAFSGQFVQHLTNQYAEDIEISFLPRDSRRVVVLGPTEEGGPHTPLIPGIEQLGLDSISGLTSELADIKGAMEEVEKAMEVLEELSMLREEEARKYEESAAKRLDAARVAVGVACEPATAHDCFLGVNSDVLVSGQKVGTVTAELSIPHVLDRVLPETRQDEGETPFAIDADGRLYAASEDELPALGNLDLRPGDYAQVRKADQDWVVVTKKDPGSGLTFGIAQPIGSGLEDIRRATLGNLGLGLALICLAMVGILPLSKRMTRNLSILTKRTRELATGNLESRVQIKAKDEFGELADAFNQMATDLGEHQRRLVQQERLEKELELCQQIQKEMLPKAPLKLSFAEVQGVSIPAREVGGDFFNFFPLPDDRMAILVGDVSGKGVAAALLMANLQATLRAKLPLTRQLDELLEQLDVEVEQSTPLGTFLTLFVGILDSNMKTLSWVSAGHDTQYLLRGDGGLEPLASSGRPLGLLSGGGYTEHSLEFKPGDSLFLYTDGLVEAENELEEEFGTGRLESILRRESGWGLDTLMADVEQALRQHRGPMEAHDDTTMVVLKITDE